MTLGPNDASRRVFDAIATAERPDSLPALQSAVGPHFRRMGVEIITAGVYRENRGVDLLFGDFDHRWSRHYLQHRWHDRAPIAAVAARTPGPVFWSDMGQSAPPDAVQLFSEAREFAIKDGHVLSMQHADGAAMVVSTAAVTSMMDPDTRMSVYLLSLHYALVGFNLWRRDQAQAPAGLTPRRRPRLTERQIECLKWTRDGKTAWEIGAILGLSSRTVEEHLNKACARLGVRTRMQAVVEAGRLNIIAL